MPKTVCPSREKLRQYSVGLLSEEDSDDLAGHLESCADCQATIVSLGDVDDTLVGHLQMPLSSDSCLAEPQLQAAVAKAAAMPGPGPLPPRAPEDPGRPASGMPPALGEYQVLAELGSGGMGRVYKALHTKLDRVVAVKVLPRGRGGDPQAISRFEREMRAVGRLAHPNIVQAYDAREIDGTPVLIMEFVDGLDLAEIVRRLGLIPVAEACQLVRQTALALQCAHEHGLVHRDIKPSNIMLTRSGELKLLDLGLARFYAEGATGVSPVWAGEEMTGSGQAMGTADYMSPEQAADSHTVDIRGDLYSLGCTLYKLLSGRAPFSGPQYRSTLEKMHAHVHQPPPPIRQLAPHVPDELAAILDRLLAKDPGDRFATPAEAAAALEPFCTGANLVGLVDQATACPLSPWERVRVRAGVEEGEGASCDAPQPAPAPSRRRPIIRRILIGLAFFGSLAAAFAAGVLITIKKNDQTYQVDVPPESHAVVDPSGNVTVNLPGKPEGKKAPALSPAAELRALQDQWKVVRVEKGEAADASWPVYGQRDINWGTVDRLHFREEYLDISSLQDGSIGTPVYRVDPTRAPKSIDIRGQDVGTETGRLVALGVYELDGSQLKICLARYLPSLDTEQQPKKLALEPGSSNVLLTLQRYQSSPDENAMQGEWSMVTFIVDGKDVSSVYGKDFSFLANTYYGGVLVPESLGLFALDPAKEPRTITFTYRTPLQGDKKGELYGIYRFDGERLTITYRKDGPRPEKFESPAGSGITLLVLERKKQESETAPTTSAPPPSAKKPEPINAAFPEVPFAPGEPAAPEAAVGKAEEKRAPAVNPAAEVKALQGEWKVVGVEKGNAVDSWRLPTRMRPTEAIDPGSIARVKTGEGILITHDFKHAIAGVFQYRIDPTASPKTIDLLGTSRGSGATATKELSALGIYEIQGDRLKLCLTKYLSSVTSEQRPDHFAIEPTSGNVLLVLDRYRPSEEEQAIQGQWRIATEVDDGEVVPEDAKRPRKLSLGPDTFFKQTSDPRPETDRGLYLMDPSKQPKAITLLREPAKTPGTTPKVLLAAEESPGIYKLEGDRLEIAYRKGGPRPEEFKSEPGSGVTLLVLQKEPPK